LVNGSAVWREGERIRQLGPRRWIEERRRRWASAEGSPPPDRGIRPPPRWPFIRYELQPPSGSDHAPVCL